MRCLLIIPLLLLVWSPAADAARFKIPRNGRVLVYNYTVNWPPTAPVTRIDVFIADKANPSYENRITWSLDSVCNAIFEFKNYGNFLIHSNAHFYPKKPIKPFKEEKNLSCAVTATEGTTTHTAYFSVVVLLQNHTICSFAEDSRPGSSCKVSEELCHRYYSSGGLNISLVKPCTIILNQAVDRESLKVSEIFTYFYFGPNNNIFGTYQYFKRYVALKITDVNDNSPICFPKNFTAEISNFTSTSFNCSDADATEINSGMVCATNSPGFLASMSGNNCVLKLTSTLRAETMPSEMKANVVVRDTAVPPSTQRRTAYEFTFAKKNSSTLHVSSIRIHLPVIKNATCGKSSYTGTVLEDAANGTAVSGDPVTAVGLDGYAVRFHVAHATLASLFRIGASSGVVTRTATSLGVGAAAVFHLPIQFFNDSAFFPNGRCVYAIKISRTAAATTAATATTTTAATATTTTAATATTTTAATATTTTKPNTVSQDSVQSSAFSPETEKQSKAVFSVSLTVEGTFQPQLANKTSPEFHAKSRTIKKELTKGYQEKFPNATVLVVVTGFRKGSLLVDYDIYVLRPLEVSVEGKLTEEKMNEITREALKGGQLKLVKVRVKASRLTFEPLPAEAAGGSHLKVAVKATTNEKFQPAFRASSPGFGAARSRFHQRLSVGFSKSEHLQAVALNVTRLWKDPRTAGTIVIFHVAFKSESDCDEGQLRQETASAFVRADFEVLRIEVTCPRVVTLPPYVIALAAVASVLCVLLVALLIALCCHDLRKKNGEQYRDPRPQGEGRRREHLDGLPPPRT